MSNAEAFVQGADSKGGTTITLENAVSTLKIETEVHANTSFRLFSQFPTEIRLYIWRLAIEALPERIIPVTEILTDTNKSGKDGTYTYISTRPHPTLSTVSHEGRTAVFENLQPLFQPGTNHTFITVCLEKDILLWDANYKFSRHLEELKRFAKAVSLEKCRKIRKLAIEIPVSWVGGGSRQHNLGMVMMVLMNRNARDLLKMFPKIETLVCIALRPWKRRLSKDVAITAGHDAAKFHIGELEFVPRGNSLSTADLADNVLQAWFSRSGITGPPGLNIKYLQLGIVGGEKQLAWDSVKRHFLWKLMTEEEKEEESQRKIRNFKAPRIL